MNHEVKNHQILLNEKGVVAEPGWARGQVWKYNRENMKAPWFRKKEWDYYLITNEEFALAFTISDLGYMGLISASYIDFQNKSAITKTKLELLPLGKRYGLGTDSKDGRAVISSKKVHMKFQKQQEKRSIECVWKGFAGNDDLKVKLTMKQPEMESMCIATPWKEKETAFYYNEKINCMPVSGKAMIGEKTLLMEPQSSFAVLDWGRGVWTYDNTWYWGTGSGLHEGVPFGFNLGYGFSDRSSASENVVFYDGKIHKLDLVTFGIPKEPNGTFQYMEPWTITSNDGRLEGRFVPILDRNANMNAGLVASEQHQVFGRLSVKVILDDKKELDIKDFLCALEVVHNRY